VSLFVCFNSLSLSFLFDKLLIFDHFIFKYRDKGLTPEIPSNCPQKFVELMQMCWKKQPQQRPVSSLFVFCLLFLHSINQPIILAFTNRFTFYSRNTLFLVFCLNNCSHSPEYTIKKLLFSIYCFLSRSRRERARVRRQSSQDSNCILVEYIQEFNTAKRRMLRIILDF
jgi:hypothetical protein